MRDTLSSISGILALLGFVPYIWSSWKGPTKPQKSTWIIWAVLDSTVAVDMYLKHTLNAQVVAATIGCWVVVALSLFIGTSGWNAVDKWCLAGAALGIALSCYITSLGMGISLGVQLLGTVPTALHVRDHPEDERTLGWWLWWAACIPTFLIIQTWDFDHVVQPAVYMAIDTIVLAAIYGGRRSQRQLTHV